MTWQLLPNSSPHSARSKRCSTSCSTTHQLSLRLQAHGETLGFAGTVIVALTATLAAVGAAGIPEAGLVTMIMVLQVGRGKREAKAQATRGSGGGPCGSVRGVCCCVLWAC